MTRKARFRQTRVRLSLTWHSEYWNSVRVVETQYVQLNSWRGAELGMTRVDADWSTPRRSLRLLALDDPLDSEKVLCG